MQCNFFLYRYHLAVAQLAVGLWGFAYHYHYLHCLYIRLVDLLRTEGKLLNGLKKLNVFGNDLNRIVKLNLNSETPENYLLDFRDSSIIVSWLNRSFHLLCIRYN